MQTLRLASARRAPQQQYKQCVRIAGVKAEPPALPCKDDVVVVCGTAASVSCLSSLDMRSSTAAGGLVPTGDAFTASETTLNEPPLRFCPTEETDLEPSCKKTSTPYASFDSSSFWRLLAAQYCWRVVDTKSSQKRTFDPGGSRSHLRACPFSRSWRALVCGEVLRAGPAGNELQRFFGVDSLAFLKRLVLIPCQEKISPSRAARGYMNSRENQRSRRHGDSRRLEVRGERLSKSVMER